MTTTDRVDPAFVREWQANLQAKRLHDLGLSYRSISIVLSEYHQVDRSVEQWRHQLRKQGAEPRPHGRLPLDEAADAC